MKKTIIFFNVLIIAFLTVLLSSCDGVISLGSRIYLDGPVVEIIEPLPRQPVDGKFVMSGTVTTDTSVNRMLIKARYNQEYVDTDGVTKYRNVELTTQWRWKGGVWEVSGNSGSTWKPVTAITIQDNQGKDVLVSPEWNGTEKSIEWKVPIDMTGITVQGGLFEFSVTAWDKSENSDSNSNKTRAITLYLNPPRVNIISPRIYPVSDLTIPGTDLHTMDTMDSSVENRRNPEYLGKLLNGPFDLQWQIIDENDVWSIDVRFYDKDLVPNWEADEDNYVYRTFINDALNRPPAPSLDQTLRPNYRVGVPDLSGSRYPERYNDGRTDELKKPVSNDKTTLLVVVRCINAAGMPLKDDERMMGYFIYWPDADNPWIEFPDGFNDSYPQSFLEPDLYTVFPESRVSMKAYDDDGVEKVVYTIYSVNAGGTLGSSVAQQTLENSAKSRVFSWQFIPPANSGEYYIRATVYDIQENNAETGVSKKSEIFGGYFRVMDINLPVIYPPTEPLASLPLFNYIKGDTIDDWTIDVFGDATDSQSIEKVSMVWINPHSVNYAAMSQLSYFRDPEYPPWSLAPDKYDDPPGEDYTFDTTDKHPNKVWNMKVVESGIEPGTGRKLYRYSNTINLKDDLNIAPGVPGFDYLKTQVFVLMASNPESKYSIITWAPQGDSEAPKISITGVTIKRGGIDDEELPFADGRPVYIGEIDKLGDTDVIEVYGSWKENSSASVDGDLDVETVVIPFINVYVNGVNIPVSLFTPSSGKAGDGVWETSVAVSTLGSGVNLSDTLVISAEITDVGGNFSEDGVSWIVDSGELKFLRVGSLSEDTVYSVGAEIDIFLEFNMPVSLKSTVNANNTVLLLNTTGGTPAKAKFKAGQNTPNVRQFFTYKVEAGQTTYQDPWVSGTEKPELGFLDVIGLEGGDAGWEDNNYPFSWRAKNEEIRITEIDRTAPPGSGFNTKKLPDYTDAAEQVYTLMGGNNIKIDTITPELIKIEPDMKTGWYIENNDIYISLTFDEPVAYNPASIPKLVLNIENGSRTSTETTAVIQSNNTVLFSYKIQAGDFTTGYSDLKIIGLTGTITDEAKNPFTPGTGFTAASPTTFTGIMVDAIKPAPPTMQVMQKTGTSPDTYAVLVTGSGRGESVNGVEPWNPRDFSSYKGNIIELGNVYLNDFYIKIVPTGARGKDHFRIEYSVNGGRDWPEYTEYNLNNTDPAPYSPEGSGEFIITARQIDEAKNTSRWLEPITLNLYRGALLTRVYSNKANNTYTEGDTIPITLEFARKVNISSAKITLNVSDDVNSEKVFNVATIGLVDEYTFDYTVGEFDNSDGHKLDLEIECLSAVDADGDEVSSLINMVYVTDNHTRLSDLKEIYILTGKPVLLGADFDSSVSGPRPDNDEYEATFVLSYDRQIFKGDTSSGPKNITFIQQQAGYRIPVILTELQAQRYLSRLNGANATAFNKYYTKGTSGFISTAPVGAGNSTGGSADTTTKYILDFDIDTHSMTWAKEFDEITEFRAASNLALAQFAEAMRQAERIELPINSSMIVIEDIKDPYTNEILSSNLRIRLEDTNSLKTLGAEYEIVYPTGFVRDRLNHQCKSSAEEDLNTIETKGVSRPAIRIKKPQEKITVPAGYEAPPFSSSNANPRFVAEQPGQSWIRMDCRTPGSQVTYNAKGLEDSSTNHRSWLTIQGSTPYPNYNSVSGIPSFNNTEYSPKPGTTGTFGDIDPVLGYAKPLEIGPAAVSGLYSGYKYRIRAAGIAGTPAVYSTNVAEELAYRTVFIFVTINLKSENGQNMNATFGDQIWIRGGNTMTGTTIPGFPLTPSDNYTSLKGSIPDPDRPGINIDARRAGIRLMNKVSGANLNNSTWQYVTWEMSVGAYFDFLLGRDETVVTNTDAARKALADKVFQYGPLNTAANIGNWTLFRDWYKAHPGERRWMINNSPNFTKNVVDGVATESGNNQQHEFTFSSSFTQRPDPGPATISQE